MRLLEWFEMRRRNGTPVPVRQFAIRVEVSDGTLRKIMQGGGCRADTAVKIIEATDGLVTLKDLTSQPQETPENAA